MQRCSPCQAALWFSRQEGFSEVFGNQRCHEYGEHLIPPSSQVPSFLLLFLCDNSYIWGGNGDEVSHRGGSYAEADTDATCLHGTDAPLPSLIPYFPLALSLLLPFKSYQQRCTFPHLSLFASAYHFPHLCLQPRYLTLSLPQFPSPSFLSDIWANNQCHFILVKEQMEFQLRALKQQLTKAVLWCRFLPLTLQHEPPNLRI